MLETTSAPDTGLSPQRALASEAATNRFTHGARMEIDCTLAYQVDGPSEFVFLIHAAADAGQSLAEESLVIEPATPFRTYSDTRSGNRFLRLQAETGPLNVVYRAVVDRGFKPVDATIAEVPVHDIPDDVLRFLMPTRYCESDHLGPTAQKMFGGLPRGYGRVQAIAEWVRANVEYRIGSTNATTTARDVFVQRSGVCRDFAHLCITFCRALNIPARLVCGYCPFPEPPPDFHAIFEAWLDGGWVRFDPTGMAPVEHVVRIAVGRDAKDVAFATIYGPARMTSMSPDVRLVAQNDAAPLSAGPDMWRRQNGNMA